MIPSRRTRPHTRGPSNAAAKAIIAVVRSLIPIALGFRSPDAPAAVATRKVRGHGLPRPGCSSPLDRVEESSCSGAASKPSVGGQPALLRVINY